MSPHHNFFAAGVLVHNCQIDRSGRWLVIKQGMANRIVDIGTGEERWLEDAEGAVGHSDCGDGILVGEDDRHEPGALVEWTLTSPQQRRLLFQRQTWDSPGLGHVSVRGDLVLVSAASRSDAPGLNELLLVRRDGSRLVRRLAPTLTDLDASGGGDDYRKMPKANLDPLGRFACWTTNLGGDRLDALLVVL